MYIFPRTKPAVRQECLDCAPILVFPAAKHLTIFLSFHLVEFGSVIGIISFLRDVFSSEGHLVL